MYEEDRQQQPDKTYLPTYLGEVEVDDDVDRLDVDPAREEVCIKGGGGGMRVCLCERFCLTMGDWGADGDNLGTQFI